MIKIAVDNAIVVEEDTPNSHIYKVVEGVTQNIVV